MLTLALLIAAPLPQTVVACDMQQEEGAPARTQQDEGSDAGHDCCDGDKADEPAPDGNCDDTSHCSACFAGASAVLTSQTSNVTPTSHFVFTAFTAPSIPGHDLPPYRPPIA